MPAPTEDGRASTYVAFEAALRAFDVRISEVVVCLKRPTLLDARLHLTGPATSASIPVRLVDGVALARRANVPLLMRDEDAARLQRSAPPGHRSINPDHSPVAADVEPFRTFIETLDLDSFPEESV